MRISNNTIDECFPRHVKTYHCSNLREWVTFSEYLAWDGIKFPDMMFCQILVTSHLQYIVERHEVLANVKTNDNTSVTFHICSITLDDNVFFDTHSFNLDNNVSTNSCFEDKIIF